MSILLTMIPSQYYIDIGRSKCTSYLILIRLPSTLVLSYIFILGKFHVFQMVWASVSFSVLIVESVFCIALYGVRYVYFQQKVSTQESWMAFLSPSIMKNILKIDIQIGLQFSDEFAAITLALYMMSFLV